MASFPRVLITGIEGFTGVHLSEYLRQEGFSVYGISFFQSNYENIVTCDLTKYDQLKAALQKVSPDYIIHLAGISFVAHKNSQDIYAANVQGSLNLLDACLEIGLTPQKIILASSASVYGNQNKEILSEDLCPQPNSHYGISKLAMEYMARNYFDKLNIMLVRPFNYTGPGQALHFVVPKIVSHFKEKKSVIELGNINVYREFNDVRYVTALYHRILISDCKSDIVNFCSGKTISLSEVLKTLTELTGHDIEVKINPQFVRTNEILSLSGSTEKLKSLLGDLPKNYSLKELLSSML